jgi:hypothetical protein
MECFLLTYPLIYRSSEFTSVGRFRIPMTPWKSQNPQTGRINKPNVPGRTNKKIVQSRNAISRTLECRPIDLLKGRFKQNKPKQTNKTENKYYGRMYPTSDNSEFRF